MNDASRFFLYLLAPLHENVGEELKGLDLLFTKAGQRGVYIIPGLVRPDSFDLTLINMRMDEIREFIGSNLIHSLSDEKNATSVGFIYNSTEI